MSAVAESDVKMSSTSQELRFKAASQLLETHKHDPMLDWPLRRWLQLDDRHLPAAWLDQTLRMMLQTPFAEIAEMRGIGEKKLEKLFAVIDRARNAIGCDRGDDFFNVDETRRGSAGEGSRFSSRAARDAHFLGAAQTPVWELNDRDWDSIVQLVRHHYLEDFALGRFTSSLRELHRSLWEERLYTFTQRRFSELIRLRG